VPTRVVRPTSNGWVGAPPRIGGQQGGRGPQPGGQPCVTAGVVGVVQDAGAVDDGAWMPAAGVDGGQRLEPVAFEAVHRPPQLQHLFGLPPGSVPARVLGRICVRIQGTDNPGHRAR
jgi:hypothetical protein